MAILKWHSNYPSYRSLLYFTPYLLSAICYPALPTFVFWIWRLPWSSRENRGSFPSRLAPFFLQVTVGSGSPDAWHLSRVTPPRACVWLDGPCLMMGGGRSFRAKCGDKRKSLLFDCNPSTAILLSWAFAGNHDYLFALCFDFAWFVNNNAWPYHKVLICDCSNCISDCRPSMLGFNLPDLSWAEVTALCGCSTVRHGARGTASHLWALITRWGLTMPNPRC